MSNTNPPITSEQLDAVLYLLGETSEEVANTLREQHITGTHKYESCPIANYVRQVLSIPAPYVVFVNAYSVRVVTSTIIARTYPPSAVNTFIRDFDGVGLTSGFYTDLYQEEA
jgi:hypothetical protein